MKRYSPAPDGDMLPLSDGAYVLYSDAHAAIRAAKREQMESCVNDADLEVRASMSKEAFHAVEAIIKRIRARWAADDARGKP